MDKDLRCALCGAEFENEADLDQHNRARHTQQGVSGVAPSNEYASESTKPSERKGREFTRGSLE